MLNGCIELNFIIFSLVEDGSVYVGETKKRVGFAVNIVSCTIQYKKDKLILQKFLRKYDNIYLTINKQVDKTSEEMDSFSMHIQLHLLLFPRRKIERAMQNLCFRFCSKCVNMADIYAL